MKFHVVYPPTSSNGQSPIRVVEQSTGREIGWINRFLDREYVRRLADKTLRTYAHNLLHFVRWWESVHHTGDRSRGQEPDWRHWRRRSTRRASQRRTAPRLPALRSR